MEALFGPELITKSGLQPTADVLGGKTAVGIYFSAHWCPPCREFTPKLGTAYEQHLKAKGLEIVFISSDRDQEGFDGYFAEHAWRLAVPYTDRAAKDRLCKKYKVKAPFLRR